MDVNKGKGRTYPCKPFPYKKYPVDVKYPCKGENAEVVREEKQAVERVPETSKKEEVVEEVIEEEVVNSSEREQKRTDAPQLKHQCSFPYFRKCKPSCIHRLVRGHYLWHRRFLNDWFTVNMNMTCWSGILLDSYERLCRIPICKPKIKEQARERAPFNAVHCVFCDQSLYYGGRIHDLHEKVPLVKKQSEERDDDIAYRIGIRTRITVHKSCYDEYLKRPMTVLENFDEDACEIASEIDSEASCVDD